MVGVTQDILQSLYKGDASCLTSEVIYNIQNKFDDNTLDIKVATLSSKKMTLQYYDSTTGTTETGKWIGDLVPEEDGI